MRDSHDFFTVLTGAAERNHSLLCVGLDPNPAQIPARFRQENPDDAGAILAWHREIIAQTQDLVCCYKPNIAFFEALGAAGMELLRQTLALIPEDIPVLLDAKRGDIGSTAEAYARACFEDLGVDAVTLSPYLGRDSVEPFARYPGKGLFVLCHTSNPGAGEFQELEIADWRSLDRAPNQALYIHVARTAVRWSPQVGLVVGATFPQAVADVRAAAPDAWFLIPGVGSQGGDLTATVRAGLRRDGSGIIVNVSRGIALAENARAAAVKFRDEINAVRIVNRELSIANGEVGNAGVLPDGRGSEGGTPRPSTLDPPSLVAALHDLGAVKFGDFTLASGIQSPIYIDLRLLVSRPQVLAQAAAAYAELLAGIACDRIAGVPYAALPIGTAVAIVADKPLIYARKEAKGHGLGRLIEGAWRPGERVTIIEDLITSGGSTIQTAETLRAAGLVVEDVIVLIDREQGGVEKLAAAGIRAHSVFRLRPLLDSLVEMGLLPVAKRAEIEAFLAVAVM
ncbi:MAG: orotidine-5'-phosphate decarboxylase [Caldilineaceae bacterium]|nr:orotidine-5'-phosphate decarboxylase [Caldilineaceae bacterium]